jgi:hypothetical protein
MPKQPIEVTPPALRVIVFSVQGTSPLMTNAFGPMAFAKVRDGMAMGEVEKKRQERDPKPPRDFDALFRDSCHISTEGWCGVPAPGVRNALIDAYCSLTGKKKPAKQGIFVLPDGYSTNGGMPLLRIIGPDPIRDERSVSQNGGMDIRVRPLWMPGWRMVIRVQFDESQFKPENIANMMHRVGTVLGIGAARPNSVKSAGLGFGLFEIVGDEGSASAPTRKKRAA